MIIGPYFFEDDDGATVSVNGDRYRVMLTDFVMPMVRENDMGDYWFQEDGTTYSSTNHQFIATVVPSATDIEKWRS